MNILFLSAAFVTGILASLGLGGGMILILYMTVWGGYSQLHAQGVNLIFFLPIAMLSVIIHRKNGLIELKELVPAMITGAVSAVIGSLAAEYIGSELLGKFFAVFIIALGIRELFRKNK